MELESKPRYGWLPWLTTILITILFVVLLRAELARQDAEWTQHLAARQATVKASINTAEQNLLRQASVFAQVISLNPGVIDLARQALDVNALKDDDKRSLESTDVRTRFQQALEPYWLQMAPFGLRELNIHFGPSGTVFLRTHKVDRFGDDLTQVSSLLVSAINSAGLVSGVEIGHYGVSYRAITPITSSTSSGSRETAFIETALAVLPPRSLDQNHGQAVLISASLARGLLWDLAQKDLNDNIKSLGNQWYLESFNNALVKEWQSKGLLTDIRLAVLLDKPGEQGKESSMAKPWIIHDQEKSYLLSLSGLAIEGAMPSVPKALVLSWSNITAEQLSHDSKNHTLYFHYLLAWVFAVIISSLLFRFNRRHVLQLLRDHSSRLKEERDLSEQARQRLTLALVSSESGFWEWDITTNRAFFSREWRELCGLPGGDGSSDIEEWLSLVHPSDKRTSYIDMIRHIKGETPMFENEYRLKIADGSYKWIFTRGKVVEWSSDGKASLMLGVYSDITERKKNEIIVVRQQAALRALNEIASAEAVDGEQHLLRALEIGSRYLGLASGAVSRIQGNHYAIKISVGQLPARDATGPLSNYLCENVLREQNIFCCDDIANSDYSTHFAHQNSKINTYIGAPIFLDGKIYGTVSFDASYCRHQNYDELDKDFMRLLARWVEVAIERWQYQSEQHLLLDRFEKLCNQLPGFLYQFQLNPDGKSFFPFSSSGIYEIYGITSEAAKSTNVDIFSVLHPDDIGWVSERISTSAATLKTFSATFRVNHPERGEIWVRAEARPERLENDATVWNGYTKEVTEEKIAALKLQEINVLREAIFDAASIAIIATDVKGTIKSFNHGAEKLLGYQASEVIDIFTPVSFHLQEEIIKRAKLLSHEIGIEVSPTFDVFTIKPREGDDDENEWTFVRKDGTHVAIILSATALRNASGEITGYLGLARDVSEIKRIDQMKSEFISTVSHELRTPLTAISGALGIVINGAAGPVPDTASKMLNIAHKNSLRLIHLVNDLLDMEKLTAGKMHFDMAMHAITPVVTQSIEANAAYAAQYNVKVVFNNVASKNLRANLDIPRLQQVLANFLSNAAKFSPQAETIEVRVEKIYDYVRVSVFDKGPGIPDEFRNRIFQKFSQADSSDSRQKGGTGLGLAICKEIIERMGGQIGFHSETGKGSQFYFELPAEEVTEGKGMEHIRRTPTGERLLVVEDDQEVAELFATLLRAHNYRVDIAFTGKSALERLALSNYQALTMDLKLPDMSGLELIRQLRNDASTKHLPVIVISGDIETQRIANRNNTVFAGVRWLQKPQTSQAIIAAVKAAIADGGDGKI